MLKCFSTYCLSSRLRISNTRGWAAERMVACNPRSLKRYMVILIGLIVVSLPPFYYWLSNLTPRNQQPVTSQSSLGLLGWEPYNVTSNYSHEFYYIRNHPNLCDGAEPPRLLIIVTSTPGHADRRLAIRQTWGSVASSKRRNVRLAFALGATADSDSQDQIDDEDQLYGDLLQESFVDDPFNQTFKAIMILHWTVKHCANATFLLKIDDDCFLNPFLLLQFLDCQQRHRLTGTSFGHLISDQVPDRDRASERYISEGEFGSGHFPGFLDGAATLFTQKAVSELYASVARVNLIHLEDVYMGLCAEREGVVLVDVPSFVERNSRPPHVCATRLTYAFKGVSVDTIRFLWWTLNDERLQTCETGSRTSSSAKSDAPKPFSEKVVKTLNTLMNAEHFTL